MTKRCSIVPPVTHSHTRRPAVAKRNTPQRDTGDAGSGGTPARDIDLKTCGALVQTETPITVAARGCRPTRARVSHGTRGGMPSPHYIMRYLYIILFSIHSCMCYGCIYTVCSLLKWLGSQQASEWRPWGSTSLR